MKTRLLWTTLTIALSANVVGCQIFDRPRQKPQAAQPAGPAQMSPETTGRPPAITPGGRATRGNDAGQANVARGQELSSQGQYEAALREFERAIESNPRLTVAYLGAGDIYRQRGDYDSAEKRYAKAAEIEPRNFDAQYLHGLTLQLLNRVSEAIRAYLRALSISPDDFNANLNLATAYLQVGEPGEALAYGRRAVQIDGRSAPARTNLGAIYAAMNRHEEAVVEYQQAAELAELSAPLLLNLADSLGKTGRFTEMVNTLQQLIRTEPTAVAHERLGSGLFRLRQYPDALAAFRKSLEIDPNHYPALNGVGVCLLNQWVWSQEKDTAARDEAIRSLRRSVQLEPQQPKIIELLGRYR
ncbi:MAG: tetratricopeptide repeat protein [Phycisphaeraceae bacterium]|nr:tetratricopeptide repeat protein [Phycisphaeraceae bacterium]